MTSYGVRMLFMQGYERDDVFSNPNIDILTRWTPFSCGCFGALGIYLRIPAYFWALGALTFIGAVSHRSIYDYLYQFFVRPLVNLGAMPRHGAPRRFGCAIGAVLFILSGTGFYMHSRMLSLLPALIIISLAFIAAFTQWCFASALYRLISGNNADCC